jgi:hypothetical protein
MIGCGIVADEYTDKHSEIVHAKFAESIRGGHLIDLASGYDGLKATEAANQALASARSGMNKRNNHAFKKTATLFSCDPSGCVGIWKFLLPNLLL